VFYSHCGNRTVTRDKSIDRRTASWIAFSLWTKHDDNTLISRLLRMHKFKEQICSSWFAPVGSASDYPLLSKWAIYGEVSIIIPLVCLQNYTQFFRFKFILVFVCSSCLPMDLGPPMKFHQSTLCGLHSLVFTLPIML
jgi:hypothetical protein